MRVVRACACVHIYTRMCMWRAHAALKVTNLSPVRMTMSIRGDRALAVLACKVAVLQEALVAVCGPREEGMDCSLQHLDLATHP